MSLFYPLQIVQFSGIKDIQIATITTIHVQSFFIFLKWNSARLHLKQSLAVQWCRLCAPNAGGSGLIPSWETKILHAAWRSKKKKQKKHTMTPIPPSSQPLATAIFLSVSMNLTSLGTSYKWKQTTTVIVCLACFTQRDVLKVHPCCSTCQDNSPF